MPSRGPHDPAPARAQTHPLRALGCFLASALLLAVSCARLGYDLTDAPASGLASFDGLVASAAGAAGSVGLSDAGSAGGAQPGPLDAASSVELPTSGGAAGAASGSAGTGEPSGVDAGGRAGSRGSSAGDPTSRACVLGGTETVVNEFDSSSPLVQARGANSSVTWTGAAGNPSPGALDLEVPAGGTAELYTANVTGDMSGRLMLLNVFVVSGTNVRMRLFVETGNPARRGYGAYVSSPLATWDCASFDLQAPASSDTGFDPRNAWGAGLEVEGSGVVEVYVDQIGY